MRRLVVARSLVQFFCLLPGYSDVVEKPWVERRQRAVFALGVVDGSFEQIPPNLLESHNKTHDQLAPYASSGVVSRSLS